MSPSKNIYLFSNCFEIFYLLLLPLLLSSLKLLTLVIDSHLLGVGLNAHHLADDQDADEGEESTQ